MIGFKDGVRTNWNPALDKIQREVTKVFDKYNLPTVVTSGNDSHHMDTSLHYRDRALDFRSWHIEGQPNPCLSEADMGGICKKIVSDIKAALGKNHDIMFETDLFKDGHQIRTQHIHVEQDDHVR